MKRFRGFILGVLAGGALVFVAQSYHVVRTVNGLETVPKLTASFGGMYVDVRDFGAAEWAEHKLLVAAILRAKKEFILTGAATTTVSQRVDALLEDIKGEAPANEE